MAIASGNEFQFELRPDALWLVFNIPARLVINVTKWFGVVGGSVDVARQTIDRPID